MFKKKHRLSRSEFDRFFAMGKRIHSPAFQLIYAPSDTAHAAVVVPKKVAKTAVERNTIRRRIYGLLYEHQKNTRTIRTLIAIAKPPLRTLPRQAVRDEIKELLLKLP